jgi:hypothetical protein
MSIQSISNFSHIHNHVTLMYQYLKCQYSGGQVLLVGRSLLRAWFMGGGGQNVAARSPRCLGDGNPPNCGSCLSAAKAFDLLKFKGVSGSQEVDSSWQTGSLAAGVAVNPKLGLP